MPTRQSVQAPVHATISPDQTPALTVSHSAVAFAPTSVGKPSFQVLTVVYTHACAPIAFSIDGSDYFTLAVDSRPKFAAHLLFTPASVHSYVHIRYVANRRGNHKGQLTIQSGDESLTIALTGQSSALLPAGRPLPAVIRRSRSERAGLLSVKKLVAGALVLLVAGLSYLTYTTAPQLFADQRAESETDQLLEQANRPDSVSSINSLSSITRQESTSTGRRRKTRTLTGQKRLNPSTSELAQQPVEASQRKGERITPPATDAREASGPDALPNPVVRETAQKRQRSPSEESDLERELNQPTRDPQH